MPSSCFHRFRVLLNHETARSPFERHHDGCLYHDASWIYPVSPSACRSACSSSAWTTAMLGKHDQRSKKLHLMHSQRWPAVPLCRNIWREGMHLMTTWKLHSIHQPWLSYIFLSSTSNCGLGGSHLYIYIYIYPDLRS